MKTIPFTRGTGPAPLPTAPLVSLDALLGDWTNTYRETGNIVSFRLERADEGYTMACRFKRESQHLGKVPVVPYADHALGRQATAFLARCDVDFGEALLACNTNKGLIIVAAYVQFRDGSGRAPYFSREFFFHENQ